jgi:3-hydroxyisobutyrate dehydrogenase
MTKERVGIVGLGRMGSAMAERLDELAAAAPAGKLVIDTSTVSPETLRVHQDAMGKAGAALLDAPISGGPEMLLAGTAGLYIGGAEKDFQRFLPVAAALSNRIHHVGGLGDGAAAKLVNNMMLMGLWQIMKEAIELGGKAGLGRGKMIEILSGSPAASPAMRSRLPVIVGETEAVGFPVSGVLKDMGVVLDLARGLGVATPAIEAARASFENAAALGYGEADLATVVRLALEGKG